MRGLVNRVEKFLIRFVIFSLLLVVVAQGLMTADPIRFFLSWAERMEGQSLELPVSSAHKDLTATVEESKSPQSKLIIEVQQYSSLPRARILVNGQEKYTFVEKQVSLDVNAGDTVEIDSTAYNFPIDYKITAISSNMANLQRGQVFTADQAIVMIGKIIVK